MLNYTPRRQMAPMSLGSDIALNGTLALENIGHGTKAIGSAASCEPSDYYYPSLDDILRWQAEYGIEFPVQAPRVHIYK